MWAEDVMGDGERVVCAESGSLRDWTSGVYAWCIKEQGHGGAHVWCIEEQGHGGAMCGV